MAKRTSKKKKNAKQHARSVSVTSDKRKDLSETDATDGNNLHEEPKPVEEEPQNPDEVEEAKGKCQHLKAVKIKKLKQALPQVKKDLNCKMCAKQPSSAKPSASAADVAGDGSSATSPAWICLTCAQLHCGRAVNKHALQHYEEMGMDHALAVNVDTFECWCYACDSEVVASSTRNQLVQEALTAIEKAIKPKYAGKMKVLELPTRSSSITRPTHKPIAPGLTNLGNTCFFNSTLQAVAATPLLHVAWSTAPGATAVFPPFTTTEDVGPLHNTLRSLAITLWTQQAGNVNPNQLFGQVAKRWKQFRGMRQQDAHELMRFLLDGVRGEEVQFLKKLQPPREQKPKSKRKRRKSASTSAPEPAIQARPEPRPLVDTVFGGQLVSVIVCDVCKSVSYSHEDFLDLSLQIAIPGPRRADSNKAGKQNFQSRLGEARKRVGDFIRSLSPVQYEREKVKEKEKDKESDRERDKDKDKEKSSNSGDDTPTDAHTPCHVSEDGRLSPIPVCAPQEERQNTMEADIPDRVQRLSLHSCPSNPADTQVEIDLAPADDPASGETDSGPSRPTTPLPGSDGGLPRLMLSRPSSPSQGEGSLIPVPTPERVARIRKLLAEPAVVESVSAGTSAGGGFMGRGKEREGAPTLMGCLRAFTSVEVLDGENRFACEKCWRYLEPVRAREWDEERRRRRRREKEEEEEKDGMEKKEEKEKDGMEGSKEEEKVKDEMEGEKEGEMVHGEKVRVAENIAMDAEEGAGAVMVDEAASISDNVSIAVSTVTSAVIVDEATSISASIDVSTVASVATVDEVASISDMASTMASVASEGSLTGSFGTDVTMPDAAVTDADTMVPDATVTVPDATVTVPDATVMVPDATMTVPDATMTVPDATVMVPDATVTVPDATVTDADTTVPDATVTVIVPDATVMDAHVAEASKEIEVMDVDRDDFVIVESKLIEDHPAHDTTEPSADDGLRSVSTPLPKPEPEKRFVLRRAYKRFLLRDPLPRVLVCHLKRFQQVGTAMRKIDEWVEFPETIDLSAFIAPEEDVEEEKAEGGPEGGRRQRTRYRLYAVVVHMGTLMGGHYIAYVLSDRVVGEKEKIGKKGEKGGKGKKKEEKVLQEETEKLLQEAEKVEADEEVIQPEDEAKAEEGEALEKARQLEDGKRREWIYCSDTSVRAASLEEVMGQKAYLLFYERC